MTPFDTNGDNLVLIYKMLITSYYKAIKILKFIFFLINLMRLVEILNGQRIGVRWLIRKGENNKGTVNFSNKVGDFPSKLNQFLKEETETEVGLRKAIKRNFSFHLWP